MKKLEKKIDYDNAIPSSMKWDNNLSNLFKTEGNEKMSIIKGRKNF